MRLFGSSTFEALDYSTSCVIQYSNYPNINADYLIGRRTPILLTTFQMPFLPQINPTKMNRSKSDNFNGGQNQTLLEL